MKKVFFLLVILSISANAQWLKINQIRDLVDSLQAKINKKDSTLYTTLYRAQIIARDSSLAAPNRAQDYIDSRLAANPYGWQTKAQVESIVGDSTNVLRGLIGSGGVDTNTVKAIAGNSIKDSLIANSRGFQTASDVSNKIKDSLNVNSRKFQDSAQVALLVDNLNNQVSNALDSYATDSRVSSLENKLDSAYILINQLFQIIDTLRIINGNPFPSAPSNLIATGGDGQITLSWTPSTSAHTSQVIYYKIGSGDVVYNLLSVVNQGVNSYIHSGLGANQTYSYYIHAVIDSIYSNPSNIASATTSSNVVYDLLTLRGNSTSDFYNSSFEENNSFSVSSGQYVINYAPTANFREDALVSRQFTPQSDSVFAGAKITMSTGLKSYMGNDEVLLFSVVDTVNNRLLFSVAALDGADSDSLYDSWKLFYWNGISNTSVTVTDSFALGRQMNIQVSANVGASGSLYMYVNNGLIRTLSGVNNAGSYGVFVLGNMNTYNGSDVPITGTVSADDIYVSSTSINYNTWAGVGSPSEGSNGWFVNKNATGKNDGTSWVDAWTSFSSINWANIQPGDTLYISGGSDSTIYYEQLNPGKSGTSGNYIVVRPGISSGHNGKVIIDGQGVRGYCIYNDNYQYISVEHLTLRWATSANYRLRASNCQVKACSLYIGTGATMGIDVRGNNTVIDGCYATTTSGIGDGQRDFIQCTASTGHIFRNNYVRLKNEDVNDHTDVFQFYSLPAGTVTMYNNILWQDNTKTSNAQGFYNTYSDDTHFIFYNNIVIAPYAKQMVTLRYSQARLTMYGNTIYQGGNVSARTVWISDPDATTIDSIVIKNNIFYGLSSTIPILDIEEQLTTGSDITNNLFYNPNKSNLIRYMGTQMTVSTWNTQTYVGTDLSGDPLFNNVSSYDFTLQSGSPAIDAGVTLGTPYNVDILGISRPQGSAYDIGAFEYVP